MMKLRQGQEKNVLQNQSLAGLKHELLQMYLYHSLRTTDSSRVLQSRFPGRKFSLA